MIKLVRILVFNRTNYIHVRVASLSGSEYYLLHAY